MVQYVIKSSGAIEEWMIVELQGELENRDPRAETFNGKYFGDLHFDAAKKPVLILGPVYAQLNDFF